MKTTAAKPMSQLERYILLTFGVLLTAVGVYFFKFPNNFSTGGVSGLSLILGRVFPSPVLTPSAFVFIINMALLVVGFIFLGRSFAFSTVYCSVVLSLAVNVMERFWPLDHPLTNQPLLELCFAVLLPAIGSAILFHLDASSGGTDIVAMIVRKYTSLNIGMALMVADALITLAALFCFGIQSGLFCILGLLMKSVLVDYVTDSFRMKKCFQIITTNPDPIIDFITVNLHRGATLEDVYGAFHHERKTMIITVLTRAQALALRRFIQCLDHNQFAVQADIGQANDILYLAEHRNPNHQQWFLDAGVLRVFQLFQSGGCDECSAALVKCFRDLRQTRRALDNARDLNAHVSTFFYDLRHIMF